MNSAEDPDISLAVVDKKIGGMGIYLVKHFMDIICYERKQKYSYSYEVLLT